MAVSIWKTATLVLVGSLAPLFGEDLSEADEMRGITYFLQHIRDSKAECLLVCCHSITIQPHGIPYLAKTGNFELAIKATVVDPVKGTSKRGEQIEFVRYSGTRKEAEEAKTLIQGALMFIFLEPFNPKTNELDVDPQNPESWGFFSEKKETLYREYLKKAKAADQAKDVDPAQEK